MAHESARAAATAHSKPFLVLSHRYTVDPNGCRSDLLADANQITDSALAIVEQVAYDLGSSDASQGCNVRALARMLDGACALLQLAQGLRDRTEDQLGHCLSAMAASAGGRP